MNKEVKRGEVTDTVTRKVTFYGSKKQGICPACGELNEYERVDCEIFETLGWSREDKSLVELFIVRGRAGECRRLLLDTIGRLVSNYIQDGADPKRVAKILLGAVCDRQDGIGPDSSLSCMDNLGKWIMEAVKFDSPDDYIVACNAKEKDE